MSKKDQNITNTLDSYLITDSALMSCIEEDENLIPNNELRVSELLSEIELINEDRNRLLRENEQVQSLKFKLRMQTVQIELLSKVATRSMEKQCQCKKRPDIPATPRKVSRNIRIASPSDLGSKKDSNLSSVSTLTRQELSHSPMHRYSSSKVRVARNVTKPSK